MAIHGAGTPLLMTEIQAEFGGANPISINEFYAAGYGVPASGVISFNDFYGKAKYLLIDPPAQGQTVAAKVDTVAPGYRGRIRFKTAATYNAPNTSSYALDFGAAFIEVDGVGSVLRGCGGAGGKGGGYNVSPTAGLAGGPAAHKRGTTTVTGFTAYGGGGGGGGGAAQHIDNSYGGYYYGGGGGGGGQSGVASAGGAGGPGGGPAGTGAPGSAGANGGPSGGGAGGAPAGGATAGANGGAWGSGAAWT